MSTAQTAPQGTKKVQRTVFDLAQFDDVKLTKDVVLPSKPTTIEEALAAVGNDSSALLSVIHDGLIERAVEAARNDMSDFRVVGDDGEPGEVYTGKYADENKGKLINASVLTLAKLNAGGSWDTLDKEAKAALKTAAVEFLRSNPAMLASIQG